MNAVPLQPSAVHPGDMFRIATVGLRSRRMRAALSALGIAIGIAAMVAVLGISESSRAELLSSLDRLGTNLLTIEAGEGFGFGSGEGLPTTAEAMLGRIEPVQAVSSVTVVVDALVRRTDLVPTTRTGGITVQATDPELVDTLRGAMADGEWLDRTRVGLPVVVLGAVAAERLGVTEVSDGTMVWIGDRWFSVIGILELFGGCHTHRDTVRAMQDAGFTVSQIERFRFPESGLPSPASTCVRGVAQRG